MCIPSLCSIACDERTVVAVAFIVVWHFTAISLVSYGSFVPIVTMFVWQNTVDSDRVLLTLVVVVVPPPKLQVMFPACLSPFADRVDSDESNARDRPPDPCSSCSVRTAERLAHAALRTPSPCDTRQLMYWSAASEACKPLFLLIKARDRRHDLCRASPLLVRRTRISPCPMVMSHPRNRHSIFPFMVPIVTPLVRQTHLEPDRFCA